MDNNRLNAQHKGQGKGSKKPNQLETIFSYLQKHVATASMVSNATGVPQKNICRYKRDLEKAKKLQQLKKAKCQKTGCKAYYLTTDPSKFKDGSTQLNLFSNES